MIHIGIISALPSCLSYLEHGVIGRAIRNQLASVEIHDLRSFGEGAHQQIDDKPFGGGQGMVMMYSPLQEALHHARKGMPTNTKVIYVSPQGKKITQQVINDIATTQQSLIFIVGRYEGIDERFLTEYVDEEWSLGDFVISGGELAAMAFTDAIIRQIPGCLGNTASSQEDSFMDGVLKYPQYTRPAKIADMEVPSVLLQGNHLEIAKWRRKHALGNTWLKRPDLLKQIVLTNEDITLLNEYKKAYNTTNLENFNSGVEE